MMEQQDALTKALRLIQDAGLVPEGITAADWLLLSLTEPVTKMSPQTPAVLALQAHKIDYDV